MQLLSFINTPQNKVFQHFLAVLGKMVHADLVRQNEYLMVENKILRSKLGKQVRTTYPEKIKLIRYGLPIGGNIKKLISIVDYSTFRRWIKDLNSGMLQSKRLGRPRKTSKEIIELIIRMATDNLDWGYGRIMGELKKLGIKKGRTTIKHIMIENGLDPAPKRYEDSWDAYIKRTFKTLYACDFFAKTIWTPLGIKTIFVLFFINIRTREVHIAESTYNPTPEWVLNKSEKIADLLKNDDSKKLLIRDGDGKYPKKFDSIFEEYNTTVKTIPYKSPNLNPYAEGFVGTIKRECLDKFFIFGKDHFDFLIREYVDYYNTDRPHSGLDNETVSSATIEIKCKSKLGGLINHYYRE